MDNGLSIQDAINIRNGRTDLVDASTYAAYLDRKAEDQRQADEWNAILANPDFQAHAEKETGKKFADISKLKLRKLRTTWTPNTQTEDEDEDEDIATGQKVTLPDGDQATIVEMDDANRAFFLVPAGAVVVLRAGAAEGEEEYYSPADLTPAAEQVASDTITADEIGRNDRVRLPGDDLPYLVDRAWTGSDGMVYIQFSSSDEEQYLPGDVFEKHPITGTLTRKSA